MTQIILRQAKYIDAVLSVIISNIDQIKSIFEYNLNDCSKKMFIIWTTKNRAQGPADLQQNTV